MHSIYEALHLRVIYFHVMYMWEEERKTVFENGEGTVASVGNILVKDYFHM